MTEDHSMHFEAGSNPTIINISKIDTFNNNGPFNAGQSMLSQLSQSMQMGASPSNDEAKGESGVEMSCEMRMRKALDAVMKDMNFRHLYDWSWVRVAMADERIGVRFSTTESFLTYLRSKGVARVPDASAVNRYVNKARRRDDGYTFTDTSDKNETIRRNNVIRRFIAEYIKNG